MDDFDLIQQFIDAMAAKGCPPQSAADIVADDQWHRIKVQGDKKPDLRYKLAIEDGFGFGCFVYFPHGEEANSWHSKSNKKWTPEERKAFKEKIAAKKAQHEKEQAAQYEQVAKVCTEVWRKAKEKQHPYLKTKGVSAAGSRVGDIPGNDGKLQKNVLLVPIYKGNALSSLQRIWPEGFKAFWEGGDVAGGYAVLGSPDNPKDNIVICEGWATGKTLREAMPEWPVFVAFNAGNLMAVAKFVRKKYPDSRIIIAADNDQWTFNRRARPADIKPKEIPGDDPRWLEWREHNRLTNPGLEKARQVGVKVAAHVIYPDIAIDDPGKNTDFNDMHKMHGIEAVRNRILVAAPAKRTPDSTGGYDDSLYAAGAPLTQEEAEALFAQVPTVEYSAEEAERLTNLYADHEPEEQEPGNEVALNADGTATAMAGSGLPPARDDWQSLIFYNDQGQPKSNSLDNTRVYIEYDPDYRGLFVFDAFAQEKVVAFKPPWERTKQFMPRTLRDEDVTWLGMHLEKKGMIPGLNNLRKVLDSCIMANQKNPAQEYFKGLKWDGVPRLDTWLRTYAGCKKDDPEYLSAVGRKWMAAAVARVMQPGCKFDHILIFEGAQNLGKSLMLRELATIHGRAYFDDTIKAKDLPNPSTVPKLQGVLIVELAEMSGFKKMGSDEAKQVISTQYDRIVKKYQNEPTIMPRQFVLAGSINPLDGYLDDPTGNRRYWPVDCTKIDIAGIKENREQLWAEAYAVWKAGEKLFLEGELYEKAIYAQRMRENIHPWQADLEKLAANRHYIYPHEIWDALVITDRTRRTRQAQDDISKIMTGLGYQYERRTVAGKKETAWHKVDGQSEIDFLEQHEQAQEAADTGEDIDW